jgi:hypothetical protein
VKIRILLIAIIASTIIASSTNSARATSLSAFAIAGSTSPAGNVSYTSGGLTIFTTSGFIFSKVAPLSALPVTISFTGMSKTGTYTYNPLTKAFDQPLTGGSFDIFKGATTYLEGTFGLSDLVGTGGAQSGNVNLKANSVDYTGGTFFPAGYTATGGSLAIEFTSVSPFVAKASGLSSFTGVDGITFSAPSPSNNHGATPEPGSIVTFSLGGLALLGLLMRSRKTRYGATLAI